tara:strand:- start:43 stop:162 length:120 start_codon:yes stop_codon:yes gene_type:complete
VEKGLLIEGLFIESFGGNRVVVVVVVVVEVEVEGLGNWT